MSGYTFPSTGDQREQRLGLPILRLGKLYSSTIPTGMEINIRIAVFIPILYCEMRKENAGMAVSEVLASL